MLFIMREEGVKLIKTSGIIDPLRYYDIFDNFCNSVPTYRYRITIFCPSGIGGKIETGFNHLRG